jgi:hypothetical protein
MREYMELGGPPGEPPRTPEAIDYVASADDFLQQPMQKGLLLYAVQRQMMCPECSTILDIDDAVLVDTQGKTTVSCSKCFDKAKQSAIDALGVNEWNKAIREKRLEITDGRKMKNVPCPH